MQLTIHNAVMGIKNGPNKSFLANSVSLEFKDSYSKISSSNSPSQCLGVGISSK